MTVVKGSVAIISDFDGTISVDDFFWYAIDEYLDKSDMQPWKDYCSGKIAHVTALTRIFEKIHVPIEEFHHFIDVFPMEEKFLPTLEECKAKNIDFFIVSAGADYYIKRLLGDNIQKYNLTIVSNPSVYEPDLGLKFILHPESYQFFDKELGVSKVKVVQSLKEKGYFCIYAGDGNPDFEACKVADVVFARKTLLELCQKAGIKTEKFETYNDIYEYVKNLEIQ